MTDVTCRGDAKPPFATWPRRGRGPAGTRRPPDQPGGGPRGGRYPGRAMRSVYLDHAATTPMQPAAIEAMTAAMATGGNASSLHTTGRAARRRLEESRETIAEKLG